MKSFLYHRTLFISIAAAVIAGVVFMMLSIGSRNNVELVTTIVEVGNVRQNVSVSGIAKAEQSAELAFPTTGIVRDVLVGVGDEVATGDILLMLDTQALTADRQDALAAISSAVATRDELLAGPTNLSREVTLQTVQTKNEALETTKANEQRKIDNAYQALLSSGITAYSNNENEDAVPPTITGTYTCKDEGTLVIDMFSSGTQSGYSYRLSGLETGTYTVSTDQAIALGKCGLRIQFDADSSYSRSQWLVDIPNKKSPLYIANRNAYTLAVTQAASAITLAEQDLLLAQASAENTNAPARSEAIARANASIAQAQARLARIDSTIADRVLRAPFAGTITEIDILPGETVASEPVVTLLARSDFEVTARIPEIDIGKLLIGQKTEMLFDARSNETLTGEITFISLKATEIDGVSYYEAIISLDQIPDWMRSGLNADIEIIIEEKSDVLRVPKRFITNSDQGAEVLILQGKITATSSVVIDLEGNDGYTAVTGVNEGDILVAP